MRKTQFFAVLVGGLLISSAPVLAQTAPAAAPAALAAPADDPNEVICHAGEAPIGSRFPGPRICHTRKEWAQIQKDSQDALFHQQMERSANGSGH
jgi:hypothetical protein